MRREGTWEGKWVHYKGGVTTRPGGGGDGGGGGGRALVWHRRTAGALSSSPARRYPDWLQQGQRRYAPTCATEPVRPVFAAEAGLPLPVAAAGNLLPAPSVVRSGVQRPSEWSWSFGPIVALCPGGASSARMMSTLLREHKEQPRRRIGTPTWPPVSPAAAPLLAMHGGDRTARPRLHPACKLAYNLVLYLYLAQYSVPVGKRKPVRATAAPMLQGGVSLETRSKPALQPGGVARARSQAHYKVRQMDLCKNSAQMKGWLARERRGQRVRGDETGGSAGQACTERLAARAQRPKGLQVVEGTGESCEASARLKAAGLWRRACGCGAAAGWNLPSALRSRR